MGKIRIEIHSKGRNMVFEKDGINDRYLWKIMFNTFNLEPKPKENKTKESEWKDVPEIS